MVYLENWAEILAAPLVLALALFTWVCFGLLYVSSFIFGLASTVVALLGVAVLVDLLAAKRRDPVGDCFPGQPAGPADGCRLAGGKVQDLRYAIQYAVYG